MSGPTYPGGDPTNPGDPNSQPGYPSYPQQPQQPYAQPPAQPPAYQPPYQQPYAQPPAQPPRKSGGSRVWIILAVVAAVLIVACVGLCAALGIGSQILATTAGNKINQLGTTVATQAQTIETQAVSADASLTVISFCTDEQNQEYSSAYSELSPSLQQQYSQAQFTQDGQQHDSSLGKVSSCLPQGDVTINGSTASVNITVTRTSTASQTSTASGQLTMIQGSDGSWEISTVPSSLNLL